MTPGASSSWQRSPDGTKDSMQNNTDVFFEVYLLLKKTRTSLNLSEFTTVPDYSSYRASDLGIQSNLYNQYILVPS